MSSGKGLTVPGINGPGSRELTSLINNLHVTSPQSTETINSAGNMTGDSSREHGFGVVMRTTNQDKQYSLYCEETRPQLCHDRMDTPFTSRHNTKEHRPRQQLEIQSQKSVTEGQTVPPRYLPASSVSQKSLNEGQPVPPRYSPASSVSQKSLNEGQPVPPRYLPASSESQKSLNEGQTIYPINFPASCESDKAGSGSNIEPDFPEPSTDESPAPQSMELFAARDRGRCLVPQVSVHSESGSEDVVSLAKCPDLKKLSLPERCSSLSSSPITDENTSSSEYGVCDSQESLDQGGEQEREDLPPEAAGGLQGFIHGTQEELTDFVEKIVYKPRDSGIYTWDGFRPARKRSVYCYKQSEEFTVKNTLHRSRGRTCGVFLCQDRESEKNFILKKVKATNYRLVGTEFLTRHRQDFLPIIYGIYKGQEDIWIFQEFIEGGSVIRCHWNLDQIYRFAECLLSACSYLHWHDVAHCDFKLTNVMVRDPKLPESLVIIDFESAKHPNPKYQFQKGGHTLTYLPPWHEDFLQLESFDPILKTADLWAIACILVFLLIPSDRQDLLNQSRCIWSKAWSDVQQRCRNGCSAWTYCGGCRKHFLYILKTQGDQILSTHLGQLLSRSIDILQWLALRKVLEYLTSCTNIQDKNVFEALSILQGNDPTHEEEDYSMH